MAIVKIKSIKNNRGIKNAVDYVSNPEKTEVEDVSELIELQDEAIAEELVSMGELSSDIEQLVDYASNPEKTSTEKLRLISGHNCSSYNAASEMESLVDYWKHRKGVEDPNSIDCYHIIQSFNPKDNDKLDYETVHKIGLKYCDMIEHIDDKQAVNRKYKMLVATHTDKDHLHNHIILCPYDIDTGKKYHDCRETYRQLRRANDELSKEYGLSIILEPDEDRMRSYKEELEIKKNGSWKDDIRKDITAMMKVCKDWDTFISYMQMAGYNIRQGKYTTYEKDGHKARDVSLGREWTKAYIIDYWKEQERDNSTVSINRDKNNYYPPKKKNRKQYKVSYYDDDGRRRSNLEVVLLAAVSIITGEQSAGSYASSGIVGNPIYETRDQKLQRMIDTISVAREENIKSIPELKERLNEAGKDLSHYRTELKKNTYTFNKMKIINTALEQYLEVKELCEKLNNLPDGEREEQQAAHASEIAQYKRSKATLYKYNCVSDKQIADFRSRYATVEKNDIELSKKVDECKSEYAKIKRMDSNIELAQSEQFTYGPETREREAR